MSNEYKDWLRDKKEENEYWISQYPFLEMKYDDCYPDDENGCWLDCLPVGWINAFGKNMCEELDNVLGDYANEWQIAQVKEKFGEMRIYHNGVPQEISNEIESIIDKYTEISYHTCSRCGAKATRYSKGWVIPFCEECFNKMR